MSLSEALRLNVQNRVTSILAAAQAVLDAIRTGSGWTWGSFGMVHEAETQILEARDGAEAVGTIKATLGIAPGVGRRPPDSEAPDAFMHKPFRSAELRQALQQVFETR